MSRMSEQRDKLRGTVKQYLKPTEPVAEEAWNPEEDGYLVPKSRLRREWRKWVRLMKSGAEVYSTRCGREAVRIIVMSNCDFEQFAKALERPPRPMPDSIRRAKGNYVSLITSDTDADYPAD